MNISRREKILLLATLYLVLMFAFYKFVYSPLNQQIAVLKQENIGLSKEKSDLQRINLDKQQRQSEIQKMRKENQQMEQKIPKDKEIVALLEVLQTAADKSGVKLLSIEYKIGGAKQLTAANSGNPDLQEVVNQAQAKLPASDPARKPLVAANSNKSSGVHVLGLNISASGRYYQLRNFLLLVEKAPRIIAVQSCSLLAETKQSIPNSSLASAESLTSASKEPPPPPPVSKGARNLAKEKENTAANAAQSSGPSEKAIDRYDMSKMQMQLQLNTYYSQ